MATRHKSTSQKTGKSDWSPLKRKAVQFIDQRAAHMNDLAQRIWDTPEMGLEEHKSAGMLGR